MLIILPNHTNTVVLGKGVGASKKISPLEEEKEQDEAVPYDPRAAEEPPPMADVEPFIEGAPRAEEVDLPSETNPRNAFLRRIYTEGDTYIPAEARKLTSMEKIRGVKLPVGFSITADDQSVFKEKMETLTALNKRIDSLKKRLPSVKERALEIENQIQVKDYKKKIKALEKEKDDVIMKIVDFEMETDFDYDDLVEIYGGDKEAYLRYENFKGKP